MGTPFRDLLFGSSRGSEKRVVAWFRGLGTPPAAEDILRDAGRVWVSAQDPKMHLGTFRSPRLAPDDRWVTTARRHRHVLCHGGKGSVFQFRGK